jgi:hypothetical protein
MLPFLVILSVWVSSGYAIGYLLASMLPFSPEFGGWVLGAVFGGLYIIYRLLKLFFRSDFWTDLDFDGPDFDGFGD